MKSKETSLEKAVEITFQEASEFLRKFDAEVRQEQKKLRHEEARAYYEYTKRYGPSGPLIRDYAQI